MNRYRLWISPYELAKKSIAVCIRNTCGLQNIYGYLLRSECGHGWNP